MAKASPTTPKAASGPRSGAMTRTRRQAAKAGFDPFQFLLDVAKDESNPLDLRISTCEKLLPYLRPKLRSVEVTGTADMVLRVVIGEG